MEIKRTANAGVLLGLDGVSILLDGICGEIKPYIKTPYAIAEELYNNLPNIVAFTHTHTDHFDKEFCSYFEEKKGQKAVWPRGDRVKSFGGVTVSSVPSRHIGRFEISHFSFIITGSKTAWFMGDASPVILKSMNDFQRPDILFVPFSYFSTESAVRLTKNVGAKHIVLLHMPKRENEGVAIWQTVEGFIKNEPNVIVLDIGETLILD